MRIHFLQHVPYEGLGCIRNWIDHKGHEVSCTRLYAADPLPHPDHVDFLIIMGGPMGIYDEADYPWLKPEKTFIQLMIESGKPILGICLGAQLLADTLGAKVYPNRQKEIGWFPVTRTETAAASKLGNVLPDSLEAFHWHGDTFDLPQGAIHLSRSADCENQAFVMDDQLVGLQYHMEMTPQGAQELIECCGDELVDGPTIQSADDIMASEQRFMSLNQAMFDLLDAMTE